MTKLRPALLLLCSLVPALALPGCGSSREAELTQQLAEARAATEAEAAARKQAEMRAAAIARDQTNAASLDQFYGQDAAPEEPMDAGDAGPGGPPEVAPEGPVADAG